MAFRNFYSALESDFSCNTNTFNSWWATNKFAGIRNTYVVDEIVTSERIILSGGTKTIYKVKFTFDPSPSFYIFNAKDSTNNYNMMVGGYGVVDTSDYKISNTFYSSLPLATYPSFYYKNSDYFYCITLIYNGNAYYYVIGRESRIQLSKVLFTNYVAPVPNSFDIYQPIVFTTQASATATKYLGTLDSAELTTTVDGTSTVFYSPVGSYSTSVGNYIINATYQGVFDTKFITINDYSSKTYQIQAISGRTFNIYSGKQVGNDFLNAYRVAYVKSNTYHTETTFPQNALQLSLISKKVPLESDTNYTFNYDISGFTETSQTTIACSISGQHKLASGASKYANLVYNKTYHLNDVIEVVNVNTLGFLTYDDNTTLDLNDVVFATQTMTSSLGNLPATITVDTPSTFTVSFAMSNTELGNLSVTFDCTFNAYSDVQSVELNGAKQNFNANEIIDYGNTSTLKLYDAEHTLLNTINYSNFSNYISNKDPRYLSVISNPQDIKYTLTSTAFGKQFTHDLAITYYEDGLDLDVSNVLRYYITDPQTFVDFVYTNLVAKVKKHTNTISNGVLTTTVTEENVSSSVTMSHATVTHVSRQTYQVLVSYTDSFGKLHTNTYDVVAEPVAVQGIVASGNNEQYYDNDVETFVLPTNQTITVLYNDDDYNYDLENFNNVTFYRDQECTQVLTVGTSLVKRNDGNSIYFKLNGYSFVGHYNISWNFDNITSVNFKSSISQINAYYGNRLSKINSQSVFTCTRSSGHSIEVSGEMFAYVNTDIIYTQPSSIAIAISGYSGEFTVANASTKITWNNPHAKVVLDVQNFQTEYNNKTDIIYPQYIQAKVEYYEDNQFNTKCDYEQTLAYSGTATTDYTKFTVTGQDDLVSYSFGTQILNLNMGTDSEKTEHIKVSAYSRWDTVNEVYNTATIKVIEILNVTGIKLLTAKTSYTVGEEFLNDSDDTTIQIMYVDTQNTNRTYTCLLRSGLTCLNIFPLKGTKLSLVNENRTVEVTAVNNSNIKFQYEISVGKVVSEFETINHSCVVLYGTVPLYFTSPKYYVVGRYAKINGQNVEATVIDQLNHRRVVNTSAGVGMSDITYYGYLDDILDETKNAKLVLFKDYIAPIEGSNNIQIKFPCYKEGNADIINKCHFGIMFGNNNSKNRMFVSGNRDYKNKDWHSSEIDSDFVDDELSLDGNYGYFEDLSECVYGETDNEVIGYDIVSNDKLLVLKSHSDKETTVYFRQPQLVTAINSSGTAVTGLDDETLYQEEFSLVKGNNSVAGISPKSIVNFNGDTLFVSNDKQVVGLDLTGIVGDNQRYANSRSYYIDEELKNQDLSKSIIWTNNYYLFITLPHKVYVTYYELKGETQYEWFVMDVDDAQSFIDIDGVVYFGDSSGKIYRFNKNFVDVRKVFSGYGVARLSVNEQTDLIMSASELSSLDDTKQYYFKPVPINDLNVGDDPYIYYSLGTVRNNSSSDCDFYVDNGDNRNVIKINRTGDALNELIDRIGEKDPVFFNHIDGTESSIVAKSGSSLLNAWGKPYYLRAYLGSNASENLYQVFDENGNLVPIKELYRARLCKRVTKELLMQIVDKANGKFKLLINNKPIDIVQYNAQSLTSVFKGEIINYSNVEAFYITKPYEMGNLEYLKTVWSFTLTNDSNIPSELNVCYATNKIPYEDMKTLALVSKDVLGFDIESFTFAKVDFEKNVVPRTYTNKRVLSGVKFLCFGFRNLVDTNAVLSSMSVTYTLPYPSYGGD